MMTSSVILWFVAYLLSQSSAFHEVEFTGHELLNRTILVQTGRRIILLKHISFRKGQIKAFHAVFGGGSKVHFQVWRRMWSPTLDELYQLVFDRSIISRIDNFTLDVDADAIRTEEGDRLGFLHDGSGTAPIRASLSAAATDTLFHQLDPFASLPNVEEVVKFDGLAYPYVFSIGASYVPDAHEDILVIGPKGDTGKTGLKGDTGIQGDTGPGATGPPGEPGDTGGRGALGSTGETGQTGLPGPPGVLGYTGPEGLPGGLGDTGLPGPEGGIGATGHTGGAGDTGATGPRGEVGPQGARGPVGAIGHTGTMGATGSTGATGPIGFTGGIGATGSTGLQGYAGPKGNSGPIGAQGPPGTVVLSPECNATLLQCEQVCKGSYGNERCDCRVGWQRNSDSKSCDDFDECEVNNGGCEMTCINIVGSYRCQCGSGTKVSPNGHSCIDIFECDVDNGGCGVAVCVDLYGKHVCVNSDSGYSVIGSQNNAIGTLVEASGLETKEDDGLLNRHMVLGFLIWLIILTVMVFILFIFILVQRSKLHKEKKVYRMYTNNREDQAARPFEQRGSPFMY